jgi:hypothetical protein
MDEQKLCNIDSMEQNSEFQCDKEGVRGLEVNTKLGLAKNLFKRIKQNF